MIQAQPSNSFLYDDEDSDDEPEYHPPLTVDEVKSYFDSHAHCAFCFSATCTESSICEIIECPNCCRYLHACKLDDHGSICPKAVVPCINKSFGCLASIRRDLHFRHLKTCPANVIHCSEYRGRKILSEPIKRRLKQFSRGFTNFIVPGEALEPKEDELDVLLALKDQEAILKALKTSRHCRTRQRCTRQAINPPLPLRFNEDGVFGSDHDSSDDEKEKDEAEMRKRKLPFALCYLCKQNPGAQHLHVLGNMQASESGSKAKTGGPKENDLPAFYARRHLFIRLNEPRSFLTSLLNATSRLNQVFVCSAVLHRTELDRHVEYHTSILLRMDGDIIKRCPAAEEGCDFYGHGLVPQGGGRLRYDQVLDSITYEPKPKSDNIIQENVLTVYGDFHCAKSLFILSPWLDARTARNLSAVNSDFRDILRCLIYPQKLVTLKWTKSETTGKWTSKRANSYSDHVDMPQLVPNYRQKSIWSKHFSECPFLRPHVGEEPEKIPKTDLRSEMYKEIREFKFPKRFHNLYPNFPIVFPQPF